MHTDTYIHACMHAYADLLWYMHTDTYIHAYMHVYADLALLDGCGRPGDDELMLELPDSCVHASILEQYKNRMEVH